jgi:hypothetical protein
MATPVPVSGITRATLGVAILLVTIAGLQLYALSTRTSEFFAWTIGAPITAAFLGAGYWANIPSLVGALRRKQWQEVRIQIVATFVFTVLILLATLRHLDVFHFQSPQLLPRIAAWAWLIVYVALPFPLILVFVQQERAGGSQEYAVQDRLHLWEQIFFAAQGLVATVIGIGLVVPVGVIQRNWPWTLPDLPAGAVGAWICGIAAASLWALREQDWRRISLFAPTYIGFWVLQILAALRFRDALNASAWQTWVYLGLALLLPLCTALIAFQHRRASGTRGVAAPGPDAETGATATG